MKLERSFRSRACGSQCACLGERMRVARLTCLTIAVLFSITCRDELITNVTDTEDVVATGLVSDPTPAGATARSLALASDVEQLVFVSLPPDSFPEGRRAVISNVRTGSTVIASMVDGGLDPVSLPALVDDVVELQVLSGTGESLAQLSVVVPKDNKPRVVRVSPAHRKRDVPLNSRPVIIFSEPIDGTTLTPASIQLLRGSTRVAGTAQFLHPSLDANHVSVEFVPTAPLSPQTEYQLIVTTAVRDLDGVALAAFDPVSFTTGTSLAGAPASISLSADTLKLVVGSSHQLTATVQDAAGNTLTDHPITWSTSSPDVVTISAAGLVTAVGDGGASVTATAGSVSRLVSIDVSPRAPASIDIAPGTATVAAKDTTFMTATVRDAEGVLIRRARVTWTSDDPSVTAFDFDASRGAPVAGVIGLQQGSTTITATIATASATATVTVGPPVPVASVTVVPDVASVLVGERVQLSATLRDAGGRKIGWRDISWTSDNAAVATVDATGWVTAVNQGSTMVTVTSEGVSDVAAITVTVLEFSSISAGGAFSCGATTSGATFCWGDNSSGKLGDGTQTSSSNPVAVIAAPIFVSVSAGFNHACALTTSGKAYCWGSNTKGQLGNGSTGFSTTPPVPVNGGLSFTTVSAGGAHTCGIATGGATYCWGNNDYGTLGDGSQNSSSVPVAVTGGLTLITLSARRHVCALTGSGTAYCWGPNEYGQLGNGSTGVSSSVPVAVQGGLAFTTVSTGGSHTCGIATNGAAYCWGDNEFGQLGINSTNASLVPVAVSGGLRFKQLDVGSLYTCGIATSGAAYCWGDNRHGELGGQPGLFSLAPVAVYDDFTYTTLSTGSIHACAMTTSRLAYCWGEDLAIGPQKVPGQR